MSQRTTGNAALLGRTRMGRDDKRQFWDVFLRKNRYEEQAIPQDEKKIGEEQQTDER